MSALLDWEPKEAALAALLNAPRTAANRARLLAALADYSRDAVREARSLGPFTPNSPDCDRALKWLLRPVFVCGHHRSGTTLLQNLLDGHPELLSLPNEGTYFASFPYVARRAATERMMDRFAAEWISRFVDPNFEPHFRLGRSNANRVPAIEFARALFGWHEALRSRVPEELAPLLALAAAYRATSEPTSGPLAWVEKTPLNEGFVGRFAFFDAARFIHVVRDPRAVLASLNEIHRTADLGRFDAAAAANSIGRSLRLAERNADRLGSRYLIVRYEDLVARPAEQMDRVRSFLGVASHPVLSVPTASGHPVAPNSSFGKDAAGTIHARRAAAILPTEQATLLGVYAAVPANRVGYEIPTPGFVTRHCVRLRYWPRHLSRIAGGGIRRALRHR